MPDRVFIDSNIFIYAKVKSQRAAKHAAVQSLLCSLDKQVVITKDGFLMAQLLRRRGPADHYVAD